MGFRRESDGSSAGVGFRKMSAAGGSSKIQGWLDQEYLGASGERRFRCAEDKFSPVAIRDCDRIHHSLGGTKHRKKRDEAEQDTKPVLVMKSSYKSIYQMGDDGSLRLSETLLQALDGSWKERPRWPDACWDQMPKAE